MASTTSTSPAQTISSGLTRSAACSSRARLSSTSVTREAPLARASRTCRQPIGPEPDHDDVVAFADAGELDWALMAHANGSATDASAKQRPSGMRLRPSTASTTCGTIMYSAKPPSNW